MLRQNRVNSRTIGKIPFHENGLRMHRRTMALREIVKHHHRFALGDQLFDHRAANIAGAAGDQDLHADLSLKWISD